MLLPIPRIARSLKPAACGLAMALLASSLPSSAFADTIREWSFPSGWAGQIDSVQTDRASRLTRATGPTGSSVAYAANLPGVRDTPVWVEIELAGWSFPAGAESDLHVGLASRSGRSTTPAAAFRLYRAEDQITGMLGVSSGRGSANTILVKFPNPATEPMRLALYVDRGALLYGAFYKAAGANEWTYIGAGRIAPNASVDNLLVAAGGPQAEALLNSVRRVAVTSTSPGPELRGATAFAGEADAPPFFTASAWAIMDANTGKVLASRNGDRRQKSASVTKSMSTHIIVELARKNPAILEEMLTFPEVATRAVGSKVQLNAGEQINVRELLYAYMVRSGNDAGQALAHHFNDRFDPPVGPQPSNAPAFRRNFTAEMNRAAQRLGMTSTTYRSVFGDGGADHQFITTAHDLLKLAQGAMKNPLFRDIAATAETTATVVRPNGTTYQGSWSQDNPLRNLTPADGFPAPFTGIKGGFTGRSRFSFLGYYNDGQNAYYTVVLGCPTREISRLETAALVRLALAGRLGEL